LPANAQSVPVQFDDLVTRHTLLAEDDRARLIQFADELDKEAAALELSTYSVVLPPAGAPHQQMQQHQVQQQQSAELPELLQVPRQKD